MDSGAGNNGTRNLEGRDSEQRNLDGDPASCVTNFMRKKILLGVIEEEYQ